MIKKFVLKLLSSPALFASVLSTVMITQPANATQTVTSMGTRLSCTRHPHSAVFGLVISAIRRRLCNFTD